jgi:hypothetical protein
MTADRTLYNGFVGRESEVFRATVVAYYGQKPLQLLNFVVQSQQRIARAL